LITIGTEAMSALAGRRFLKMNGLGNQIVVLDLRGTAVTVSADEARAIAAHPRSPFDQLMIIHDPRGPGADAFIRIMNNDGSDAGACGNGMRCVAWALCVDPPISGGIARDHLRLETQAGMLEAWMRDETTFTVDMGAPRFDWQDIPLRDPFPDTRYIELQAGPIDAPVLHSPSAVNMGNPHAVFFVDDLDAHDLARFGPMLENHPIFPDRANISLAQVISPSRIRLKVWERGAGLTQACGSAACATLVAAARRKFTRREATVSLPGGDLDIVWRESDSHVLMTGPVEMEWEDRFPADFFTGAA